MPQRRTLLLSSLATLAAGSIGILKWRYSDAGISLDTGTMMTVERLPGGPDGAGILRFAGRAGPLGTYASEVGLIEPRSLFPNPADPFAINDRLSLGQGGYALEVPDRGRARMAPGANDRPWALNMIPFGVALDGVILDPSGPWYDGGMPDPNNPFDRHCTGWEYEVMHPKVARLVGVPDAIAGHVQPSGMFHYHGYPALLAALLRQPSAPQGKVLMGFSADGFPVVDYRAIAADGESQLFQFSGYVLRQGKRAALALTNPDYTPSGLHDGLYVQDYVFDPAAKEALIRRRLSTGGDYHGLTAANLDAGRARYVILDERNGTTADDAFPLADYPASVWHYVLTPDWPYIPRVLAFEPAMSFADIIPRSSRQRLYSNCEGGLDHVHRWHGRAAY